MQFISLSLLNNDDDAINSDNTVFIKCITTSAIDSTKMA